MGLNELAKQIHQNAKSKGFWDKEREIGTRLMLCVSELAEAMEADRMGKYSDTLEITTYPDGYEEWREIQGYEGEYEVSNLGNVRSLDMHVFNGVVFYSKSGRVLKKGLGGTGYNTVSLKGKTHKVARLVAMSFCDGYSEGMAVNHIDGIKTHDYSNNLEWVTSSENNNHAVRTGLRSMKKTLTKDEMTDIAFMCKSKIPHKEIHSIYPQISLSRIKGISRARDKYTETFEFELADTIIRILDLCGAKGIDIEKHIELKMKYNESREKMHGKKY